VEEAKRIVAEGIEARLAAADDSAEEEAECDRLELLNFRGDDANHTEQVIAKIRRGKNT
jgi:hypothetical protein